MKVNQHVIQALLLLGLWLGWMLTVQAQTRTVHLYYTDPQGTVLAKTDVQGNILARYDYTPYGNAVASLGSPPNGPGYTGHVNDPETGLVYMQARYYQPDGRFLSPDPVGPVPGNIYSFNRYAYANNNPIVNTDPTGMSCMLDSDPCEPDQLPPTQPPPPTPPLPKTVTTLAAVTVTATAEPIAWGEIGEGVFSPVRGMSVSVSAPGAIIVGALLPITMGAAPCEMPGHSPCGMMSELGETAPSDAPPGTLPLDKAKGKFGLDKDTLHGIKDAASGGLGGGKTWIGVAPDGTVGTNEGGRWTPQGTVDELKP